MSITENEIKQIWNKHHENENLSLLGKLMFKSKIKAIKKTFKSIPVNNMIEVGCGTGSTLSIFKELNINSFGIDISEYAIEICKKKELNVCLKALEDVTETYELVSSDGLLEHFLNFEKYALQLMRISSKYILLIQPNHGSFSGKTLVYLSEIIKGRKNVYEYNYLIEDFVDIFKKNGFGIIKNEPIFGNVFRFLLFQKKSS